MRKSKIRDDSNIFRSKVFKCHHRIRTTTATRLKATRLAARVGSVTSTPKIQRQNSTRDVGNKEQRKKKN